MLTYENVRDRDPFVLIADGLKSERVHSFARVLDGHLYDDLDPRLVLAHELVAAALGVHPAEVRATVSSGRPCDLDRKRELNGLLMTIYGHLNDLPHRLWDALLIELGNGEHLHALTILQIHSNTVRNIITRIDPDRDAAPSHAAAD